LLVWLFPGTCRFLERPAEPQAATEGSDRDLAPDAVGFFVE